MKRIRVLLVEDEPEISRQQQRLLAKSESIEICAVASCGLDGVRYAAEFMPDVILLDLGLPDIDGIEVTRRVKSEFPEMEIIIFTIFDEETRVIEAIRAGAAGYLLKGMSSNKMIEAILEVNSGGSVIQPHLARSILRHFRSVPDVGIDREVVKSPLTPREEEILKYIAKGLSNREVAGIISVSMATVRTHLEHIYSKLDVTNRTEAVTEGYKKGIIPLE
ncbi:MAG: response regulator transcription factor [Deltaproteobacteria bacterium]|nr:response regulator transcription factor [Deltaproteobacteria bacterium]